MSEIPYHLNLSTVQRGKGQSSTRKAAYNAGERIRDLRRQQTYDYRYKKAGVVAVDVSLPPGCSTELSRSLFWNAVEAKERRWDAWVAREFKGALPHNLSDQGRRNVTVGFNRFLAQRLNTYVMACIHLPGRGDQRNDHVHVLFPTRTFDGEHLGKKHRFLDSPNTSRPFVIECRALFARLINQELAKEGIDEFVDHRSYDERGISAIPGKHLGPKRSWRKKKMEEEIADVEVAQGRVEGSDAKTPSPHPGNRPQADTAAVEPLSEAELEAATRAVQRVILTYEQSQPVPPGPFSFSSDGVLVMEPAFRARIEKTKQIEATEGPKKGNNLTLHEFLLTWRMACELIEERRKERKKEDQERRDQQPGR